MPEFDFTYGKAQPGKNIIVLTEFELKSTKVIKYYANPF
jgi:hypothetical protein